MGKKYTGFIAWVSVIVFAAGLGGCSKTGESAPTAAASATVSASAKGQDSEAGARDFISRLPESERARFQAAGIYKLQEVATPDSLPGFAIRDDLQAAIGAGQTIGWADDQGYLTYMQAPDTGYNGVSAAQITPPSELAPRDVVWHSAHENHTLYSLEGVSSIVGARGDGRYLAITDTAWQTEPQNASPLRLQLWDLEQLEKGPRVLVDAPSMDTGERGNYIADAMVFIGDWFWFAYSDANGTHLDRLQLSTGEREHIADGLSYSGGNLAFWNGTVVATVDAQGPTGNTANAAGSAENEAGTKTRGEKLQQFDASSGEKLPLDERLAGLNFVSSFVATPHDLGLNSARSSKASPEYLVVTESVLSEGSGDVQWIIPATGEAKYVDPAASPAPEGWKIGQPVGEYLPVAVEEGTMALHLPSGNWCKLDAKIIGEGLHGPLLTAQS